MVRRLPKPKEGLPIHEVYDETGRLKMEFQVGPHGRVEWARAQLRPEYLRQGSAPSPKARLWIQTHGTDGDDAGHIFPKCAGFSGDVPYNIFIHNANFNRGVCSQSDQMIKHALEQGKCGILEVEFMFPSTSHPRPYKWHEQINFSGSFYSNDTVANPVGRANLFTYAKNYQYEEGRCPGCKEFKWTDYGRDSDGGSSSGTSNVTQQNQSTSGERGHTSGNGEIEQRPSHSGNSEGRSTADYIGGALLGLFVLGLSAAMLIGGKMEQDAFTRSFVDERNATATPVRNTRASSVSSVRVNSVNNAASTQLKLYPDKSQCVRLLEYSAGVAVVLGAAALKKKV